jgi:hypothetical protein
MKPKEVADSDGRLAWAFNYDEPTENGAIAACGHAAAQS